MTLAFAVKEKKNEVPLFLERSSYILEKLPTSGFCNKLNTKVLIITVL